MTTTPNVLPPRRPPTAGDGLLRLLPDPVRCAADLLVVPALALAWWSPAHTGLTWADGTYTLHAEWEPVAMVGVALGALAAIAAFGWQGRARARPHVTVCVLAGFAAFGGFAVTSTRCYEPTIGPAAGGADGARWRVVRGYPGFSLGRELDGLPWHVDVRLVARSERGAQLSARLVRPASRDVTPEHGIVVVGDTHVLCVGEEGPDYCRIAYAVADGAVLADGDLAHLSPFLLLADDERGREVDVQRLESTIANARDDDDPERHGWVVPEDWVLHDAFDSPNAWVRAAAARLVRAGGPELYPEATKRL